MKCISMSLFKFFPKKEPFTVKCVSFSLRFSLSVSSFVRSFCVRVQLQRNYTQLEVSRDESSEYNKQLRRQSPPGGGFGPPGRRKQGARGVDIPPPSQLWQEQKEKLLLRRPRIITCPSIFSDLPSVLSLDFKCGT